MYKKLDEETIEALFETGIDEFASKGLDRANINEIAKKSGLSVGVIYKYFHDKDQFFLACVEHSLKLLDAAIEDVLANEDDIASCMRLLIRRLMDAAESHANYSVMYNEITSGSCKKYAVDLAGKIEGHTAKVYAALVEKAQKEGKIRYQGNPRMFAFFFDSLLMMMQYSFSCEYYKERLKIFCGEEVFDNKDELANCFMEFMSLALGLKEG